MTTPFLILSTVFLAGLIILLLPDNNDRMIRLNKNHGPSLLDLAGIILMISAWLASCILVIKKWAGIIKSIGRSTTFFLFVLYLFSLSGVVLSLVLSLELLLWINVTIAVITNASLIITAMRAKDYDREI